MDFSEVLYYDETSPSFLRWKVDRYKGKNHNQKFISAGDVAGCINGLGYYQVNINCVAYLAHRVVYQIVSGVELPYGKSKTLIDHKDQNKANNKFDNLRLTTHSANQRNKKKCSSNTSGTTGVSTMYIKASNNTYFTGMWRDAEGVQRVKTFSILKYGLLPAFRMAVLFRQEKLKELNLAGAGYTDNHGK